jgi:hypothetical protein
MGMGRSDGNGHAGSIDAAAKSETSTVLRQGLPRGFLDYMGVMFEEAKSDKLPESLQRNAEEEISENPYTKERGLLREEFRILAKRRIMHIAQTAMNLIDASCE